MQAELATHTQYQICNFLLVHFTLEKDISQMNVRLSVRKQSGNETRLESDTESYTISPLNFVPHTKRKRGREKEEEWEGGMGGENERGEEGGEEKKEEWGGGMGGENERGEEGGEEKEGEWGGGRGEGGRGGGRRRKAHLFLHWVFVVL